MVNNFFNMMPPQMQANIKSIQQQALQSGNPQQFLIERYGNDPVFQEGLNIFNTQGIQGLNKFIASRMNH